MTNPVTDAIELCAQVCENEGCELCATAVRRLNDKPPPELDGDAHPGRAHVRASEIARRARGYVQPGDVTSTNDGRVPGLTNRD